MARRIPTVTPNPDVCHGTAGAGLAQLYFWEQTKTEQFLNRAVHCADKLIDTVEQDGHNVLWRIPGAFNSTLAGTLHYGYAHGVAGIGAFLLSVGRATGNATYRELAYHAAETLISVAHVEDGAAQWPIGPNEPTLKSNWCSGSSGVGSFLIRVWQENGDEQALALSEKAAVAIRSRRWHSGTAQCHGLAGDGEFLLDLAEITGKDEYRRWASELAQSIYVRHLVMSGRILVPDDSGVAVSSAFNTGSGGALAFLHRLGQGGDRFWIPASLSVISS
jgi:lantibiotic modifying enzyme